MSDTGIRHIIFDIILCLLLGTHLSAKAGIYQNPILDNGADPSILKYDGVFYLYRALSTDDVPCVNVYLSTNLVDWSGETTVYQNTEMEAIWAVNAYQHTNNQIYLYYSHIGTNGLNHIHAVESDSPTGPFTNDTEIISLPHVIDPFLFRNHHGNLYLYFKNDDSNNIMVRELSDPMTPKSGTTEQTVLTAESGTWEDGSAYDLPAQMENPHAFEYNGLYYLMYSGSIARSVDYAIGYATATDPTGPFSKADGNPIFKKNLSSGIYGPGGSETFIDSAGGWWIVYHQKKNDGFNFNRFICMDRLNISETGKLSGTATKESDETAPVGGPSILETGQVQWDRDDDGWEVIPIRGTFRDPVIVMGPPSINGEDPITVRIRQTTPGFFEYKLDEWDYMDGIHSETETVSYMVMEKGVHCIDGKIFEAGTVTNVNHTWNTHSFSHPFAGQQTVLAQCVSWNGPAAVCTRLKNITGTSFEVKVREEKNSDDDHKKEIIHYIAIENGTSDQSLFESGKTESITHQWTNIVFTSCSASPLLFANISTTEEDDPCTLRYRSLSADSAELHIEEENSDGLNDLAHAAETVNWFVSTQMIHAVSSSSSYNQWSSEHQLIYGLTGDDDGDGQLNLAEFALGTNPVSNETSATAFPAFSRSSDGYLEYIYIRQQANGLTCELQSTTNLIYGLWTPAAYAAETISSLNDELETVTNRILPERQQQFFRLQIQLQ